MTLRLLAEREPYESYLAEKDPEGSFFLYPYPAPEGEDPGDLLVLPAERFLALAERERMSACVFAYGAVGPMDEAFRAGCADYLREPWSLIELRARARRIERIRISAGIHRFELRGPCLSCSDRASPEAGRDDRLTLPEAQRILLRLFALNPGKVLPRTALAYALWGTSRPLTRALDSQIAALRVSLECIAPGEGWRLQAARGHGYRLLVDACG
jgi:hypothetical protein